MVDYALEGPKWASSTITWSFATANYAGQPAEFSSYFGPGLFETEIKAAFADWAGVANLQFTQVADGPGVHIRLGLAGIDGPSGTLATTTLYYTTRAGTPSTIQPGVVIAFDSGERYGVVNGHEQLASGATFKAVALHEIGHALGLDHYSGTQAIMNPVASAANTGLTLSDVHGIQSLYGPATPAPAPLLASAGTTAAPVGGPSASASAGLTAAYRFYDTSTGDHFYTTDPGEKAAIQKGLPSYVYEGVKWATPAKGADTVDVFRFYDSATRDHFYTASVAERDQVIKSLATYHYEGVAFQAYADTRSGGTALERFYNTETHVHHYAADAGEVRAILSGAAGAGWVDEGPGFVVHAPSADMLLL